MSLLCWCFCFSAYLAVIDLTSLLFMLSSSSLLLLLLSSLLLLCWGCCFSVHPILFDVASLLLLLSSSSLWLLLPFIVAGYPGIISICPVALTFYFTPTSFLGPQEVDGNHLTIWPYCRCYLATYQNREQISFHVHKSSKEKKKSTQTKSIKPDNTMWLGTRKASWSKRRKTPDTTTKSTTRSRRGFIYSAFFFLCPLLEIQTKDFTSLNNSRQKIFSE